MNSKKELSEISRITPRKIIKKCENLKARRAIATIMKDFTAKEQIFLLDIISRQKITSENVLHSFIK